MGVKWGDLPFTDQAIFTGNVTSTESGVYAIMTKPDPQNKPDIYRILYFGETEDFSQRLDDNHEKYDCWKKNEVSGIYYELYVMHASTQQQRQQTESALVKQYDPVCND